MSIRYFSVAAAVLLPVLCAAETVYEFLTPELLVLKSDSAITIKSSSVPIIMTGVWEKENALVRSGNGEIKREADTTCFLYTEFIRPLEDQEVLTMETSGGIVEVRYDRSEPSNIFKFNQVGNGLLQPQKYAYMGMWLGSAGPLPLKHLEGKTFEIRRASDNETVFEGIIKMRRTDVFYQNMIPFTGEEVAELDYSAFAMPGEYYFYVENIGRSRDFIIGSEAVSEAFFIHARGLYHKRCGTAKTLPFTAWESPACHLSVVRGRFPGNADHYRKGEPGRQYGFFDRKDNQVDVNVFELIKANKPYSEDIVAAAGGWHDAADYDRRPYHLRIVCDLAAVYLLKPENFTDNQLNIPESGNGIPDILDEAAWGLKHLLAVQEENGGVGTWFETTEHPQAGDGLPDKDENIYYVSAPSRNSSLEYAAAASYLALALKKAGFEDEAEKYFDSAEKAWSFAMNPKNRLIAAFQYRDTVIFYREEPFLKAENLLICAVNMFALTDDPVYLEVITAEKAKIMDALKRDFWRWSPLYLTVPGISPAAGLDDIWNEYKKQIISNADIRLEEQETAYPYRTLWYGADAAWVHSMAWGNYHPLRRAVMLIAAHAFTGDEKYLAGAYLANDFHNGANPLGRSMTSGLGNIYPVAFLDLVSYADGYGEFVPGITPFGNTFGMDGNAVKMVYGSTADSLPIWRRYVNLEFLSVPASEYSVWETIAPAVVTTGYLLEKAEPLPDELKKMIPAEDFRTLPGYRALP